MRSGLFADLGSMRGDNSASLSSKRVIEAAGDGNKGPSRRRRAATGGLLTLEACTLVTSGAAILFALTISSLQAGCASDHEAHSGGRTELALRPVASAAQAEIVSELACSGAEVHPRACCSATEGCFLIGLDGDHPPCFEGFEEVQASDACCAANGDARPVCRGAEASWSPPESVR